VSNLDALTVRYLINKVLDHYFSSKMPKKNTSLEKEVMKQFLKEQWDTQSDVMELAHKMVNSFITDVI
jgi:uncharacterized protein involved in exopolysaccharide biosynthesis